MSQFVQGLDNRLALTAQVAWVLAQRAVNATETKTFVGSKGSRLLTRELGPCREELRGGRLEGPVSLNRCLHWVRGRLNSRFEVLGSIHNLSHRGRFLEELCGHTVQIVSIYSGSSVVDIRRS